jgi:hypothetical protein
VYLYIHSPVRLRGVVLNSLRTATTLPLPLPYCKMLQYETIASLDSTWPMLCDWRAGILCNVKHMVLFCRIFSQTPFYSTGFDSFSVPADYANCTNCARKGQRTNDKWLFPYKLPQIIMLDRTVSHHTQIFASPSENYVT